MSEYLNDGRLSGQISTGDNHIGGQNQNDPRTNLNSIDSQKQEHSSDNQVHNGENTINPNVYEQRNAGNQDQNGPANNQGVQHKTSAPDHNALNPSAQEFGAERPISLTNTRRPIEKRQGSPKDTRSEIKVAHNTSSAHAESQNIDETRENVTADLGVDQQSFEQAQEHHEIQKPASGGAKIPDEAVTRDVSSSVPFRGLNNERSGLDVVSDTTDGPRSPSIVEARKSTQGISSDIQMDGIHRDGSNGVTNVDEQRPSPTQEHDSNLGDQGSELDSQVQIKNQGNHSRPTDEIRESVPSAQADIKEPAIVSNPKIKDQNADGNQNVEHNRNSDENVERHHSTCDRTRDGQKSEERKSLPSQRTTTERHGANSLSSQEAVSNERSLDTHDMSNVASGGEEISMISHLLISELE
ncbi:hypothetical protein F5890DRAFT_1628010 [Lentinula detonsa]|uniref:Uncharacterized protein n=1 Tax=Lentinula detonsa TaxID=2804962 RepID=A0AA38PR34_9AGAR|nr:hypothetical protein F5890DRAFT_1628010 [Lentinula detonsa]